ncbi:MAG: hypothetical protein IJI21_00265 [Clostridia bacterium]|nr:hypothetical protein [Clostridia bacterium]
MTQSSAYILAQGIDYQYHFCGVISIQYAYSSLVASGSDNAIGTDFLNGVRNQPTQVTLTVAESDAMRQDGWSARMIAALEGIKMGRYLCTLVTPMKTYDNMVLTDFTAVQDEYSQSGWSGTLTFTKTSLFGWGKAKDNASVIVHTAAPGAVQTISNEVPATVVSSGSSGGGGSGGGTASRSAPALSPLQQMAQRAGVRL